MSLTSDSGFSSFQGDPKEKPMEMEQNPAEIVFDQPSIVCQILGHIKSFRQKIRLGRVNRLFATAAQRSQSWCHNDSLIFVDHNESDPALAIVLLNGETVHITDLPAILTVLLARIKLKVLRLSACNAELVYEMVLARMCSAEQMPEIHTLTLTGRGKDTNLMPFIWACQRTLKTLHFGNCVFSSRMRVVEFWKSVQACHKLQEFRHLQFRSHVDSISLEEDVVNALRGKRLHTLYLIALRNLSPNGITELLRCIPVRCLKRLSLSHSNVSLRTIRDQVDETHRLGLREFRFGPFPADGTDDQLAVAIPQIFPNLRRCILEAQALTFPSATVIETIDRFLNHLEQGLMANSARRSPNEGNHRFEVVEDTKPRQPVVTLCMSIYYQHIEVLEKVLGRIVREKGCSVTPVKYSHVRDGYLIERNGVKVIFYDFELIETE